MKIALRILVLTGILLPAGTRLYSQQAAAPAPAAPAQAEDKTAPSYDLKAQAVLDLQQLQQKFTTLAAATPQEKFSWRPAEGIRSVGEVFLHTAAAEFNFPVMGGATPAEGFQAKGFEKSTTDKAQIIEWLNKSFAFSIAAVQSMSNADFAVLMPKLGPQANKGDVVYLNVVHAHEMLGQSIAYSRSIGVVPPWTAAQKKAAAKTP